MTSTSQISMGAKLWWHYMMFVFHKYVFIRISEIYATSNSVEL
jgi:hypothetical protein